MKLTHSQHPTATVARYLTGPSAKGFRHTSYVFMQKSVAEVFKLQLKISAQVHLLREKICIKKHHPSFEMRMPGP